MQLRRLSGLERQKLDDDYRETIKLISELDPSTDTNEIDEGRHRPLHVLDPGEEGALAEEAVVDRDVEAPAVGCEESVHARVHRSSSPASRSVRVRSPTPSKAPTAVVASAPAALANRAQRSSGQPASLP